MRAEWCPHCLCSSGIKQKHWQLHGQNSETSHSSSVPVQNVKCNWIDLARQLWLQGSGNQALIFLTCSSLPSSSRSNGDFCLLLLITPHCMDMPLIPAHAHLYWRGMTRLPALCSPSPQCPSAGEVVLQLYSPWKTPPRKDIQRCLCHWSNSEKIQHNWKEDAPPDLSLVTVRLEPQLFSSSQSESVERK